MVCPFCASEDVESVSAWGGQLITRQLRCRACSTYFEAVRDDFSGPTSGVDPVTGPVDG
jgi:formate dehydrogenase maturation protein FdhE